MLKISIAEDSQMFRKLLGNMLANNYNYNIITLAANGKELVDAMDANKNNIPDIVLLDLRMPVMDGYETAKQLQRKYPTVQIIALSMFHYNDSVLQFLQYGAKAYINKNTDPSVIELCINCVCKEQYFFNEYITPQLVKQARKSKYVSLILSEKEKAFLQYLTQDLHYAEIASLLCVSIKTVENYRDALLKKAGVHSKTALLAWAIQHGHVIL